MNMVTKVGVFLLGLFIVSTNIPFNKAVHADAMHLRMQKPCEFVVGSTVMHGTCYIDAEDWDEMLLDSIDAAIRLGERTALEQSVEPQ